MKVIALIIIFFINISLSLAQYEKKDITDSLKEVIPSLQDKSQIAQTYSRIGTSYMHTNTDSSVYYLLQCLQLADEIRDFDLAGKSYNDLSFVYRELGQYDSALYYSKEALNIIEQQNDPLAKAKLFYAIALIFKTKGQYDTAHTLLVQNLELLRKIHNKRGMAVNYNALGQLSEHKSDYPSALEYYFDAIAIYQELGDASGEAILYNNIGIVYDNMELYTEALWYYNLYYSYNVKVGDKYRMAIGLKNAGNILEKTGELDSAIFNYKAALKIDSLLGSHESMSYDLLGLGSASLAKDNFAPAFHFFHRALGLSKDPIVTVPAVIGIGTIHMQHHTLDSALFYYKIALKRCQEVDLPNEKKDVLFQLYQLYNILGDIEKSFDYFREYVGIKDSIFSNKSIQKVANLKAGFEFEKERRKQEVIRNIEINRAKSIRNIFILGTVLAAIIAFLLYVIYERKKAANEKLNELYEKVKKQALELRSLDQTKSHFYTNISHELRTPLTLISSPLEYLLSNENHEKEVKYHLELMSRNTRYLRILVDDILDLSKLESEKLSNEKEKIEISIFVKRVFSNFESFAKFRNINYQLNLNLLGKNTIEIDHLKLEKVLNNLLSNAIKYTPSSGQVVMRVKKNENFLNFEIEDNGQGIDSDDLPHIFNKYFQSKEAKTRMQRGSGIGLALSRELTTIIGGQLNVKSDKGVGSLFTLSIPYEPVNNAIEISQKEDYQPSISASYFTPLPNSVRSEKSNQTLPNILIVEDHPEMQGFLKRLLDAIGIIYLSNNGKQALEVLSKEPIDLIVSDIMMPGMDGYELLEFIRQNESYSGIPFILLTALQKESNLLKALSIGADDYVIKPFSPNELIARAKNMLRRHKIREIYTSKELSSINRTENNILPRYRNMVSEKDRELIERVEKVLLNHLEDENFSLKKLTDIFCLSFRQMERNLKKITGLTPKQFQQEISMQHARKLLEEGKYGNLTAIAYSVGIKHVTRFSNLYEKRFGKRPESYFE